MLLLTEEIAISTRRLRSIVNDPEKTAMAVNLRYVSDAESGIQRMRKGKNFSYLLNGKPLRDPQQLERIKKLVIPPAWERVWICRYENGHLQATGVDTKNRKQYKYHALWSSLRNHTKFYRLHEFGRHMPAIRRQIEQDLSLKGLPLRKVLAAVVSLMERTSIRVGNGLYEKLYGSFGLTTLKDQHVRIRGHEMTFIFTGKKGIPHRVSLRSKRLASIVSQCRDIPGKELFQYIDENGQRNQIDSGMVNEYIQNLTGGDYTAKDFRTWSGTVHALVALHDAGKAATMTACKKNILNALDYVARQLGNTRSVCKKYYVHPLILSLYESGRLHKYLAELSELEKCDPYDLACEEKVLMKILSKESVTS